jgi:glycosyltransferase involved in cell wall biosynthesis
MNRLSSYGGKWIKNGNWYPDKKIRLWDRRMGNWGGGTPHEKVILSKGIRAIHIEGDLMHIAYKDSEQTISKIQQYSSIFARENRKRKRTSIAKILGHTFFSFSKSFFIKLGLLDGFEGLMVAAAEANHVFYKYSKLFEANKRLQVSLVITTYNRKDALELVLLSVRRQRILPFEVIIADDGSGVDTKLLIERIQNDFPIPLHHCWHEDQGFRLSAIRNKAVNMASGEYIIMVDGDMVLPRDFVVAHTEHAWHGDFIQGSRVLLMKDKTARMLEKKEARINFFASGIDNRMNGVQSNLLSKLFSYYRTGLNNVRGANLSFWKEDVITVNGFNEDFEGWGREDSEFAVRMENQGIKRKHLKFAGFGYHLFHAENSRKQLPQNDAILQDTIDKKLKRCENGISKKSVSKAA